MKTRNKAHNLNLHKRLSIGTIFLVSVVQIIHYYLIFDSFSEFLILIGPAFTCIIGAALMISESHRIFIPFLVSVLLILFAKYYFLGTLIGIYTGWYAIRYQAFRRYS